METLKEVTLFMLAGQMLLHLLPSREYGKYVRVILGVMLLSRLMIPLLSLAEPGTEELFSGALERYGQEMERIGAQAASLTLPESDHAGQGLLESVQRRLAACARSQGIRITDAAADEEGRLILTVAQDAGEEGMGGERIRVNPITVFPTEGQKGTEGKERAEGEEGGGTEELRELFARTLCMEKERLEVVWDG